MPVSYNHPSAPGFDTVIREHRARSDANLYYAISRSLLNQRDQQQLSDCVKNLRIYRNLFMHTYVHLVLCCRYRKLDRLLNYATDWKSWNSVEQLARHSLIKTPLLEFWSGNPCQQHKSAQRSVTSDDDSDLLFHLLYCSRRQELYELPRKPAISARHESLQESKEVIELIWQFLKKRQDAEDIVRRLRACIYRMARKFAYLPHGLQIRDSLISNEQPFGYSGANGALTKARMRGKEIIIKKIVCDNRATRQKNLEMFASEAILWGTLQHKNIVPFIGVITEDFGIRLVSPFLKNGNVRNYTNGRDPKRRLALSARLGRDLAEALKYIHYHEPPIIHGDIKGDNVLVNDDGHACLGDFGQSHASDSGKYLDSTRVGIAMCPWHWMAPEIISEGEGTKATDKSDIYSFGCVLYEMLSGRYPFDGLSPSGVMTRVQKGERPDRPEWISRDDSLWKVVRECWATHPGARPSAKDLVHLLK